MPRTDVTRLDSYDHGHAIDMTAGNKESHLPEEKKTKREIANMNERRRMQNINTGFQSLRSLLPSKHDGEKLSKAAILQHTSTYIYELETNVSKLAAQNTELVRLLNAKEGGEAWNNKWPDWVNKLGSQPPDCPSCKRRRFENNNKLDIDSSSPFGGDGSSTESSSEHDSSSKFKNRSFKSSRTRRNESSSRNSRKESFEDGYASSKPSLINYGDQNVIDEVEIASESIEMDLRNNENLMTNLARGQQPQQLVFLNSISGSLPPAILTPQQRITKPNAIALPIDVPFMPLAENGDNSLSEVEPQQHQHHSQSQQPPLAMATLNGSHQLIFVNSSTILSSMSKSNGQPTSPIVPVSNSQHVDAEAYKQLETRRNLNSIVEAIRQLEGDDLFADDQRKRKAREEEDDNMKHDNEEKEAKKEKTEVMQRPNVIVVNNCDN